MIIEQVNTPAYMNGFAYDYIKDKAKNGYNPDVALIKKPKFNIAEPITYIANEGMHVRIHLKKDAKEIRKIYKEYYKKPCPEYISGRELLKMLLKDKMPNKFIFFTKDSWPRSILIDVKDTSASNVYQQMEITVYDFNSFTPLPLTKGQQKKIQEAETAKNKATFHAMVAKDIMVAELNKLGYDIGVYNNRYLEFTQIKGYNKLLRDALEYYINEKVFKDVGCQIKVPKVKNQHKYGFNDFLCDLGYVELDLK